MRSPWWSRATRAGRWHRGNGLNRRRAGALTASTDIIGPSVSAAQETAVVGANIFHFFLQMLVLLGFMLLLRYQFESRYLALVVPALVVEVLFLAGLSLIVSSLTVYLRDIAHFMELALLFWFWMTPIVYQPRLVFDKFAHHHLPFGLYLLNPMATVVLAFQRAFYYHVNPLYRNPTTHQIKPSPVLIAFPLTWYFQVLGILALVAIVLVWIGFSVFGK